MREDMAVIAVPRIGADVHHQLPEEACAALAGRIAQNLG
jgi:hypothetical protein